MIEVKDTPIEGLKLILPALFADERGYFTMSYHREHFVQHGIEDIFVQDNEALSRKGVLRGLHYQTGSHVQSKLVRVTRGTVWDVAVDMRPESTTYGEWYGVEISESNRWQLYIPAGFAHGYVALEDNTVFTYKCGELYAPQAEGGVVYDDPEIGIEWPDPGVPYLISEKDRRLPSFGQHRPIDQ